MKEVQNFINGTYVSPHSGSYIDSINPATGKIHAKVYVTFHFVGLMQL